MSNSAPSPSLLRHPAVPYIAPFLAYVGIMAIEHALHLPPLWAYPLRFFVTLAVVLAVSRPVIGLRPSSPMLSVLLGAAVFAIWIGPDVLWNYRTHWLFENAITGKAVTSLPAELKSNWWFIACRFAGATLLVPVVEELFWRSWMMRWLINVDFLKVPLGKYVPSAFWLVALLFASEHGSYWEVGLICGVLYNAWLVRTRNLADCILAHAVTNGMLSVYVLTADKWQYWL